jgi:hypothetical protein
MYYEILKKIKDNPYNKGSFVGYYRVNMNSESEYQNIKTVGLQKLVSISSVFEQWQKEGGQRQQWYVKLNPYGEKYLKEYEKSESDTERKNIDNELLLQYFQNVLQVLSNTNEHIQKILGEIRDGNEESRKSSKNAQRWSSDCLKT